MAKKQNASSSEHSVATVFHDFRAELHDAAVDPRRKTVHHLRTNTRRIETMLRKLLPPGAEKKLENDLTKIRRVAGEIRDLDVLSKIVGEFDSQDANSARSRAFVSARLDLLRARNEKKFLQALARQRIHKIEARLRPAERRLNAAMGAASQTDLVGAALSEYTNVSSQFEPLDASNLHEFRKACKHARYLAELASDGTRKEKVVEQLKRIQDSIGEWHDVIVLMEMAGDALRHPKHSVFLRELRDFRNAKLKAALSTTDDAKHELLRLQLQVMTSPGKPMRSAAQGARSKRPARAAS